LGPTPDGGGRTSFFRCKDAIGRPVVILMHTLETAAAAVGRNKNAILRAIEAGKIPVAQAENGEIQIDPADH